MVSAEDSPELVAVLELGQTRSVTESCLLPSFLEVGVLDDEVTDRRSRAVVHRLAPHPTPTLVEHNIACDAHMLCNRVEDAVGLHAVRVADEDP